METSTGCSTVDARGLARKRTFNSRISCSKPVPRTTESKALTNLLARVMEPMENNLMRTTELTVSNPMRTTGLTERSLLTKKDPTKKVMIPMDIAS